MTNPYDVIGTLILVLVLLPAFGLACLRGLWLIWRVAATWHQKIWD